MSNDGPVWVEAEPGSYEKQRKQHCLELIDKAWNGGPITGSHSEQIMVAMAVGRMDELHDQSWTKDPWSAWFHRLDDFQREVVNEWREKNPHGW